MTTLLIDGDVEAFAASCVSQEIIDWDSGGKDGGGTTVELNEDGAEDYLVSALNHYKEHLGADRLIVCLSDKDNWRKKLWAGYKANRKDIARPLLLEHCKKFLADRYEVESWPRLEADDVMGLLSQTVPGSIIVSVDKDMKNVPCRLYNPKHPDRGVVTISLTARPQGNRNRSVNRLPPFWPVLQGSSRPLSSNFGEKVFSSLS